MKNFALIGAAGYIAPRHMQAIADTGNRLVAAMDPHDSVGTMDRFFPEALFFTEGERFDRFLECARLDNNGDRIDYVSVCSPNHLHDAHVRQGLRVHADVVCEKPLTITPRNLEALATLEREYNRKVYTVLQLRLLPSLIALKQRLDTQRKGAVADVVLTYVTRRGPWYDVSWKGNQDKSGGVAMNIGIHFFDLVLWLFGSCRRSELHLSGPQRMAGYLELERANVRWLLSLDRGDLPKASVQRGEPAYRSLTIDGSELELTGFADLHTATYRDILNGGGFGLEDALPSVQLVDSLRHTDVAASPGSLHPHLSPPSWARRSHSTQVRARPG